MTGVQFLAEVMEFLSLCHCAQTGSGVHPAYQMGTRGSFPGGKAVRA